MPVPCSTEVRLVEHLSRARRLYAAATAALESESTVSDEPFEQVEAARMLYLKARTELKQHYAEHGCNSYQLSASSGGSE